MPRNKQPTLTEQRPPSRDLRVLKQLFSFLRPYRTAVLGAVVALLIAVAAVLGFGVVLQRVVDQGLSRGSGAALNQAALEQLMQARTTLIIAHRLATVRKVDQILVMDRGRIVASGRHDELVAEHGLYARLAALQFRDMPEPLVQPAAGQV